MHQANVRLLVTFLRTIQKKRLKCLSLNARSEFDDSIALQHTQSELGNTHRVGSPGGEPRGGEHACDLVVGGLPVLLLGGGYFIVQSMH
jgi:hypothetical protein